MASIKRLKRIFIMMLLSFLFCACVGRGNSAVVEDAEEGVLFRKTVKELDLNVNEANAFLLAISDTSCYYVAEKHEEELHEVRKVDFKTNEEKCLFQLKEEIRSISLCGVEQEQESLNVLSCDDEKVFLRRVNDQGEEVRKIVLNLGADDRYGLKGVCERKDGKYWVYWWNAYCLMDEEGLCSERIPVRNAIIQNVILADNDKTYASLLYEDTQASVLRDLEGASNKEISLPGSGEYLFSLKNHEILAFADGMLYEIDLETEEKKEVLDLKNYVGISSDTIRAIWADETEYRFLCVSMLSGRMRTSLQSFTELSEEEKAVHKNEEKPEGEYDQYGRQIVRIYDPGGWQVSDTIINEYNTISEKYCVVAERERKDEALILTTQNAPDIMVVTDFRDIERYCQKGYLADLLPYMERSEKLSAEDLMEWEFTCYGWENGLYGLSESFLVTTLIGKKSQLGEKKAWTTDEYLTFLETHPHVVGYGPWDRTQVLWYGIMGNLEAYVNFENGTANFEQKSFREFLSRIKDLQLESESLENSDDIIGEDVDFMSIVGYQTADSIAELRTRMGDDFVIKGFPNDQGKGMTFLESSGCLSIISNGKCKEGAYDFLEYVMLLDLYYYDARNDPNTSGKLYGLKELYQKDQENSLGPREQKVIKVETGTEFVKRYEVTQEDVDLLKSDVDQAVTDTLEARTIQFIIIEEAMAYFDGNVSLDATCDAIQGRVQLLLDENR